MNILVSTSIPRLGLLFLMLALGSCKKEVDPEVRGEIHTVVDQPPTFPGGRTELNTYLGKNVRYPAQASRQNIQGTVILDFVVTDVGRIAHIQIKQSVGGGCDEEVIRVVKSMPNWIPGRHNGKPVNVQTSLPFVFKIL